MPSPTHRAPLLLALIVVLGVGGRFVREGSSSEQASAVDRGGLDAQLAKAERAAREGAGRASRGRRAKGSADSSSRRRTGRAGDAGAREGAREGARAGAREGTRQGTRQPTLQGAIQPAPRSETTPIGAIAPEALAALRASERGAHRPSERARAQATSAPDATGRRRVRGASPSLPVPSIDVESASAAELERLPRIGPALARRIVEDRAARGPFGSLKGLQRVRGVGPAMARRLQGHVTFGVAGRP